VISCVFCDLLGAEHQGGRFVAGNKHAAALRDGFPVSDGHTLIVPRRHVCSVFELAGEEQMDVWNLVAEVRDQLQLSLTQAPDAFNVGPNDGIQAGQTVLHAHVHVIPRYNGDMPDPRGGIRWVLPRKANYWKPEEADPFQQVEFLGFIQSLLEHGEFVSTYKFALLQALADLSLESDAEVDGTLRISLVSIAEKVIAYYWPQAAPFHLGHVLRQNTGPKNAAIIGKVAELRNRHSTLHMARSSGPQWRSLVSAVSSQIKLMPLFKLQTVGRKRVETLYANQIVGGCIILHKGVQDCFRRFYGIVVRLCRREWLDMVRKLNNATISAPLDLAEFLFGSERNQWPGIRPILRELQDGQCFYCQQSIRRGQEELDHFIPWSLYPNDLAHNFVLACRSCNGRKSDDLAMVEALDRWVERNKTYGHKIVAEAELIGLPIDANASARVAAWAYAREQGKQMA
jgi:diadenosine tetraphosphate (Ap4A) HIT family hydrolase/5-methylcytosine-specific restriction endonuclease McrA